MSWKATAYVKAITSGITQSEKLVMLILADYHHTTSQAAWPSLAVLAEECLMSERNVRRILVSLEGRHLRRRLGLGRGHFTVYQFIGLDPIKEDNMSAFSVGEKGTQKRTNGTEKADSTGSAIRKEQKQPVLGTGMEKLKTRNELERRGDLKNARLKGLRDFSRHPIEDWEEPLQSWEIELSNMRANRMKAASA